MQPRILTIVLIAALGAGYPQTAEISGVVFDDANRNGARDAGERGVPGVAVSNQDAVVTTDANGAFRLAGVGTGVVFVSTPDGYRAVGPFWRAADSGRPLSFALARDQASAELTFVHASDTHISPASLPRTQRLRSLVDSIRPGLLLITGDLVRDALRVSEAEAVGYYSFTRGGVHFVGLNTVDIDDQQYYGHVDSLQLAWLERDLALVPATIPVVTFDHIPFFTTVDGLNGYNDRPPAPSLISVKGKTVYRHNSRGAGLESISGVTLYRVKNGEIDAGRFIPLERAK